MWRFRGTINGIVTSASQDLPMVVDNFSLVNKGGSAATVNVYSVISSSQVCMMPMSKSISAGSNYESVRPFVLLATEVIKVQTDGQIDYDFNISNTESPEVNG